MSFLACDSKQTSVSPNSSLECFRLLCIFTGDTNSTWKVVGMLGAVQAGVGTGCVDVDEDSPTSGGKRLSSQSKPLGSF